MQKSIFLLLTCISYTGICLAQLSGLSQIRGSVITADQEAAVYANILVYRASDSTLVKGDAADSEGAFFIENVAPSTYFVEVQFLGHDAYQSDVFDLAPEDIKDFGRITLAESTSILAEVTVSAQRPLIEVQPDKTVFNVDGSINATGNTALELLRKSPGVVVDNSNNIILSGKNGVRIYIDGKPSFLSSSDLAALLSSMQSSEIDAIEIITNPGAKYEAEGNAGIINIRLKKDKSLGTNINMNAGYSYGTYAKYNTTTTFNKRSKKVNFFGTYSHNDGQSLSWLSLYRTQGDFIYDDYTTTISSGAYNSLRLGTDIDLNDKSSFGVLVNGFVNNRDWVNNNTTPILDARSGERISFLEALTDTDGRRQRLNANVNYQFDNKSGTTWNLDADWGIFRNTNTAFQPNYFKTPDEEVITRSNIFYSSAPTDIDIYTFQADHERLLGDVRLSAGARFSYVSTDNTYDFFEEIGDARVLDIDRSNQFVFDERIHAAYVTLNKSMNKFNVTGGLRMEQTISEGILTAVKSTDNNVVMRNYLDFFPSLGITYNPDQKNQFRINYSRRIDRPSYQDLNPFEFKLSELSYSRGNPFLTPQYTNSVSLAHTYNYRLTTSLSYSHTSDFFANISDSTEVSRTFLETINLDYQKVISLNVSYPFSPTDFWSTYTSLTAYNTRNKAELGPGREVNLSATVANVYHQSTFSLPGDLSFEVSGWYSSPSIWGAVYETDALYSIDTGIQKKFAAGRGTIKVSVTDIFNSAPWSAIQDFAGFYVDAAGGWESRQIRVNMSYLLGNNQLKKSKTRKAGLEKEASRIN